MATSPIQPLGQNSCLVEDYSKNISLKLLSKYQNEKKKNYFHFSYYKSMETSESFRFIPLLALTEKIFEYLFLQI